MTFFIVGVPVAVSLLFILYYYVAVTSRTPIHRPHVTSTTLKPTLPHFTLPPEIMEPLDKLKEIAAYLSSIPPFPGGLPGFIPGIGGLIPGGGGIGGLIPGVGGIGVQPPPQFIPADTKQSTPYWFYITRALGFKEETPPAGVDFDFQSTKSALENYGDEFDPDRKERFPPEPIPPGGHLGSFGAPHKPY